MDMAMVLADRSMEDKAFIHIGLAKTGTTSIQHLFANRRHMLMRDGFYYPSSGLTKAITGHHCLAWHVGNAAKLKAFCGRFKIDDLRAEIFENRHRTIVISSEELSLLSFDIGQIEQVLSVLPRRRVIPIAYVREQAEFFNSFYAELLSDFQDPGSIEEFHESLLSEPRYDYSCWLENWRSCVGDGMVIRPYDKTFLRDSDVVRDFCQTIGWERLLHKPRLLPEKNVTLNNLQISVMIELIRRTKAESCEYPLSLEVKRALKRLVSPILGLEKLRTGERFWGINARTVKRIRKTFSEPNSRFFDSYKMPGFAFSSVHETPAVNIVDFDAIDPAARQEIDVLWKEAASVLRQGRLGVQRETC